VWDAAPSTKLRRVDWFPNKKPGSPGVSGPTLARGVWIDAEPNRDGGN